MAIQKISVNEFLDLASTNILLDVRSPSEYTHAHIPGAINLPLFSDEQRKIVGTAYKQESRENAIKIGLDYFGPNMKSIVETVEKLTQVNTENSDIPKIVLVHCWRGGMRSGAIAWLLDLYGFKVYLLDGGYKAYRNWVLALFDRKYKIIIIGGYTGTGKTPLLHELYINSQQIVDLEAIASHKGSALGGIGLEPQTSQEMFENNLGSCLITLNLDRTIYIEDESQRIGNLQIPIHFYTTMQQSKVYFLDIGFEKRLDYLTLEYGQLSNYELVNAVLRIQKRLGGLETKNAISFLIDKNYREAFRILLKYYDKWYGKSLWGKENANDLISTISAENIDPLFNCQLVLTAKV